MYGHFYTHTHIDVLFSYKKKEKNLAIFHDKDES